MNVNGKPINKLTQANPKMPIGLEAMLSGVVDLVSMKAIYFEGDAGEDVQITEVLRRQYYDCLILLACILSYHLCVVDAILGADHESGSATMVGRFQTE